ncbi:MAG: HNH endonuclease [Chitinophagaceae bacterium]|nr:HNH endonuclease [Oligoflexus sp.]
MWDFDEEYIARERQKAKELKKSRWWQNLIQKTRCYYCQKPISRTEVTMDHVVPISRGGKSTAGNLVPACKSCNEQKRSLTAVEWVDYLEGFKNSPDTFAEPKPETLKKE